MDEFKPVLRHGRCVNGCLPLTERGRELQTAAAGAAVPLPEYSWQEKGDMPVVKWDADFEKWLDRRIELAESYRDRNLCLLPWEVFKAVPEARRKSEILNWNQGSRPSCSMHGAAHAFQFATLAAMALGAPLEYEALNPIYSFYLARGGNLAGGLDMFTTAAWVNRNGMYPASLVGSDNMNIGANFARHEAEARKWQSGIVFIEDRFQEKIVRACRALCPVCFGAGRLFTSAKIDRNGIKVMDGMVSGGHAQCFAGYRSAQGEEYVFNANSHGPCYGQSPEGEPKWGAWVGAEQLAAYCSDMEAYGYPFVVFPEGCFNEEPRLYGDIPLPPYPRNWIK